jgi:hypothetical protein
MPQAVQVETQPEQQGLAHLLPERPTWRAGRELALHRREQRFNEGAAPVELARKRPPHFGTHSAHAPGLLPTLAGDHTLGPEPLADISAIPLAVELGVGQDHPRRVCSEAASTTAGKLAQSFQGPRRALCERRNR